MQVRPLKTVKTAALTLLLLPAIQAAALAAPEKPTGIKLEGYPTNISAQQATFTIERFRSVKVDRGVVPPLPFQIIAQANAKFELRHDQKVNRSEFFRALKPTNRVEVKGYVQGSKIVAYKLEIEE